jgi:hypothetical protein
MGDDGLSSNLPKTTFLSSDSPQSNPEIGTWAQVVYLENNPRKQREHERMKQGKKE